MTMIYNSQHDNRKYSRQNNSFSILLDLVVVADFLVSIKSRKKAAKDSYLCFDTLHSSFCKHSPLILSKADLDPDSFL